MFHDPHNTFRPTDAFEFTDAYRWGCSQKPEQLRQRMQDLNARMDRVQLTQDIPRYMLAAYRGYEAALCFVELQILPGVVKIDDTDPTRCEVLTPAGYAHTGAA